MRASIISENMREISQACWQTHLDGETITAASSNTIWIDVHGID